MEVREETVGKMLYMLTILPELVIIYLLAMPLYFMFLNQNDLHLN